jgi:hypothetical protein
MSILFSIPESNDSIRVFTYFSHSDGTSGAKTFQKKCPSMIREENEDRLIRRTHTRISVWTRSWVMHDGWSRRLPRAGAATTPQGRAARDVRDGVDGARLVWSRSGWCGAFIGVCTRLLRPAPNMGTSEIVAIDIVLLGASALRDWRQVNYRKEV